MNGPAAMASSDPGRAAILLLPKDWLNHAGTELGHWVDTLGPAALHQDVWDGITPARLIAAGSGILFLLGLVQLLLFRTRRWSRRHVGEPTAWPRILTAGAEPLLLLFFTFGVYLSLVPALAGLDDRPTRDAAFVTFSWLADLAALASWFWLVIRIVHALEEKSREWAFRQEGSWQGLAVELTARIVRVGAPLLVALLILPLLQLPLPIDEFARKALAITFIVSVCALIIRGISIFQRVVLLQHRMDVADNLSARKISTQVRVVGRIIIWVVAILGTGSALMVFESVRQFGTSILASAGVAGIILGFAAQRTLGNLIAGIQIAISQPIRYDDVLIIEGEFGRVEEINLTFVTLKLWDLRRIIVPITYFFERPFQNWTRTGSKLLGSAFLYTDYTVPVPELREEMERVVAASPLWDGDVCGLQVTDCRESTVEIRCLMSAKDAGSAFDLRCLVRETLIDYIRKNHAGALPRTRLEWSRPMTP